MLVRKIGKILLRLLIVAAFLYPVLLLVFNSFKPYSEIMTNFLSLPKDISFEPYIKAWKELDFSRLFLNNILYTSVVMIVILFAASMAGYALARTNTRLSKLLSVIMVLPIMVPFQSFMMTMTKHYSTLGLTGTRGGYMMVMAGLLIPFATFLIKNFVSTVPLELEECGRIDGAGRFRIFFSIVAPLLTPILITVIVIDVISIWNDFFIQLLMLSGKNELYNIQYKLYAEFSAKASNWETALPGIVISLVPIVVFFIALQKKIVEGIVSGALKG